MHARSVYIAREQFIHYQTVERTQAHSEDFHTHVVRALLHTRVFMKFKSSCTVVKWHLFHWNTISHRIGKGMFLKSFVAVCIV